MDQNTPESTVRSYYEAFNRGDVDAIQSLLDSSDASNKTAIEAIRASFQEGKTVQFSNIQTRMVENDGQTARLYGITHTRIQQGGQVLQDGDGGEPFTVVNKSGRWYIVGAGQAYPPGWLKQ